MIIKIKGHIPAPKNSTDEELIKWANDVMLIEAKEYSRLNLAMHTKINDKKLFQWKWKMRYLYPDELKKIAKVIGVKMYVKY